MQDDRKKTIVLAALFVVMLGVGAFQLMPKPQTIPTTKKPVLTPLPGALATSANASTAAKPETASGADPASEATPAEPPLAERDPFEAPPGADPAAKSNIKPSGNAPIVASSGLSAPIKEISGNIGAVTLPSATALKDAASGTTASTAVKPAEPVFAFRVVGLTSGPRPLAIFADATGNQRLIRAGAAIDPDSKLVAVDRASATVVFRGKTLRLFLVGDQNAK